MHHKTVLITGASSGIGEACARRLAALGYQLILVARRAERLKALADELTQAGALVYTYVIDLREADAIPALFQSLPAAFTAIDVLINNAGLALGVDTLAEADPDDWSEMIDTNVKALLYMTQQVLSGMLARKTGHIVNIGSTASYNVYPGGAVYCGTKHAVHAITKALQLEVAGKGVRVTEIDPGMVETEFSVVRFKGDVQRAKKLYEGMERPLTGVDIADAIIYAITCPPHVNIARLMLYATDQTERLPS